MSVNVGLDSPNVTICKKENPDSKVSASFFLDSATKALEDRASQRDTPSGERSMQRTVALYNAYKRNLEMSEADGWAFMVFLKLVRGDQGEFREDDYVDATGYIALLGETKSQS